MAFVLIRFIRRSAAAPLALASMLHPGTVAAGDVIFADGFDIDFANAYFVSPGGLDTNPGTKASPFLTISKGIADAAADAQKHTVVVAAGSYKESVTLANGVSLFGEFDSGAWARDPANATILDGFAVFGPANANPGGNSYAIYVSGSNANLHISHNAIFAGHGGPGMAGTPGTDGNDGVDGAAYSATLDSFTATGTGQCNVSNNRAAAGGGALTCAGAISVDGGSGGGNNCTPAYSTQNSTSAFPATAGKPGGGESGGSAGAAGVRGYDAELNGSTCFVPVNVSAQQLPQFGSNGADGSNGGSAGGGGGCATPSGSVFGGDWIGGSAPDAGGGSNGGGGGGGAAGGGAVCTTSGTCKDMLGGHGGGGGSGGCGGSGGSGGGPGGGAFGIFIVGGSAAIVAGNTLFLGAGGDGGSGGNGGVGGLGGNGSQGGQVDTLFCTGKGGSGGNGGQGGSGAGGGGGCGGASFGVYTFGVGMPPYCAAGSNTTFGGFGGAGGVGGSSFVNPGGSGQVGVLAACSLNN
jgi:hypothetical protein